MAEEEKPLEIDPKLLEDPVFQRVLADGLEMQDRFSAEPVYARTGKGYLKSAGVEEIKAAKEAERVKEGDCSEGEERKFE